MSRAGMIAVRNEDGRFSRERFFVADEEIESIVSESEKAILRGFAKIIAAEAKEDIIKHKEKLEKPANENKI